VAQNIGNRNWKLSLPKMDVSAANPGHLHSNQGSRRLNRIREWIAPHFKWHIKCVENSGLEVICHLALGRFFLPDRKIELVVSKLSI